MKNFRILLLAMALPVSFSACKKDDDPEPFKGPFTMGPIANFHASGMGSSSVYMAPAEITFYNNSSNATSYTWDFGDGTAVSTAATPEVKHTFTQGGTFTVKLTAHGVDGATGVTAMDMEILPTPPQVALITAKPYRLTAATLQTWNSTQNLLNQLDACERDDLIYFRHNGVFNKVDAGIQCIPTTAITNGSWSFSSDYMYINFPNSMGSGSQMRVSSLTNTSLVIKYQDAWGSSEYTLTYTAQ